MIHPTNNDIGRGVVYRARHIPDDRAGERGFITSFNNEYVFVRYGGSSSSQATKREDLKWESA
jgi:hypothetical protein